MNKNVRTEFTTTTLAGFLLCFSSGSAMAGGELSIMFNPADFEDPVIIDNPYWPLLPGGVASRTFTYIGETEDECVINTIEIAAGDTKILSGANNATYSGFVAQVVVDKEYAFEDVDECDTSIVLDDESLTELTQDWYRQDKNGNVWYLGELSRDFGDGCPPLGMDDDIPDECFEGSWEAGLYGPDMQIVAEAGIVVPSDTPYGPMSSPLTPGTYYKQEVAEGAQDMAKVLKMNANVSVDFGDEDYENCRKVKEWTALEPGGSVEHKFYCMGEDPDDGPGLVLINGIGGGPTESEELVKITTTQ